MNAVSDNGATPPLEAARPEPTEESTRDLGWALTILFVTAAGVINAVVLTLLNVTGGGPGQPAAILGLALAFAQEGLVALLCGFSRKPFAFLAPLFIMATVVSGLLACRYDGPTGLHGTWIAALLMHGSLVLVFAWCCRARGWHFRRDGDPVPTLVRPWQFSMAQLFALTTAAAILSWFFTHYPIHPRAAVMLLGVIAPLLAIVPGQICLQQLLRASLAVSIATSFACTFALAYLLQMLIRPLDFQTSLLLILLQTLIIVAAIGIVRLAGYRLMK